PLALLWLASQEISVYWVCNAPKILQSPAQLWLTSGQTAKLDCKISEEEEWRVRWYKEQQNGNLHGIHQSSESESLDGKYSSKVNITANMFSLIISNIQRDDSGVYYCGLSASVYLQPNFGNGTRLIVTGEFSMLPSRDFPSWCPPPQRMLSFPLTFLCSACSLISLLPGVKFSGTLVRRHLTVRWMLEP
uniref:Ig-like domain-containing protein n=1 Tax=Chelonoidis abingdonii TaxID=106734 RepID=A0A8C0QLV0_CHEAB